MEHITDSPVFDSRHRLVLQNPVLSRQQRRVALATLVLPALGTVLALLWSWKHGLANITIMTTLALYAFTTAGLTVGYHRCFTHRSFNARALTKALLAIGAMMAAQGPLLFWVASHRRHHARSDREGDCHSPVIFGSRTFTSRLHGLWHAHVGWMLAGEITNVPLLVRDLLRDDLLIALNRYYLAWIGLGFAIPALIGFVHGGAHGALEGVLWGGFARVFFVHQITWSVNSLNHMLGARRYENDDNSTNIGWLALINMGESWHNNHHAHPASARFGHAWWEIDVGYWLIRSLEAVGQCGEVRCQTSDRDARTQTRADGEQ